MESELFTIFLGAFMILMVLGITVSAIVKSVLDYKRDQNELRGQQDVGEINKVAERTQMIEDRLHVLERIATDRGHLLSDEIDALRGTIAHEKVEEHG